MSPELFEQINALILIVVVCVAALIFIWKMLNGDGQ